MEQHEELTEFEEELEETAGERDGGADAVSELNEKYLRLAAEYDNFRKRTSRERETLVSESQHFTVKLLLPVLDNLERAAARPCADEACAQGVAMILKQWVELMEKIGVAPIDALNKPFDPNLHNAVMHTDDESLPAQTVVEVFQTGYMAGGKVLRPSMVRVAN